MDSTRWNRQARRRKLTWALAIIATAGWLLVGMLYVQARDARSYAQACNGTIKEHVLWITRTIPSN